MKHKSLLILLLALLTSTTLRAYDAEIDGICYNFISENEAEVTRTYLNGGYSGVVVIPASITYNSMTYSVTNIGEGAFYRCGGLTSVTILSNVTSIGDYAFSYCSGLTSVTIPSSVTRIGDGAFSECSGLTSITIPNSVTSIGSWAFSGCISLTSIKIEEGNTVYDSRNDCNAIIVTSTNALIVGCQSTIIPGSVTSIGEGAFYGCFFAKTNFINNSSLTSSYNWGATLGDEETSDGLLISDNTIVRCRPMATSVTIPNSVTSIGDYAFMGCSSLTSVSIPNSVTSIGRQAFFECISLTSVSIPNSVTFIGNYAFSICKGLTSVTIPNSVKSIGTGVFDGCSSLISVTIPNSVTSIGSNAFNCCSSLTSITVEEGNTIYDSRNDCNAIIETATNTLILGCQNTIIPGSVTSIGWCAFDCCIGLTSVTIPNSVTNIDYRAFSYCSGLTSVTIPNSVTSIGRCAFEYCTGLTSVTIGNSVTSIGDDAFSYCSGLKEIYCYAEETPKLGGYYYNVFSGVDVSKVLLVVPDDAVEKYKAHEDWGKFWIETPTGIVEIENGKLKVESSNEDWYDLSGRKLDKPQRGINIIRMSDGTTRKVLIK